MSFPQEILRTMTGAVILIAAAGMASCSGTYGNGGGVAPPPGLTFTIDPAIVRAGESAELSWNATASADCTATGGWSGAEPAAGTLRVVPDSPGRIMYTLTCTASMDSRYPGGGTTVVKSVTLDVTPADAFSDTELVTGIASALVVDVHIANPWGIAIAANTTAWIANNESDSARLYNGNGNAQPTAGPLTVNLPTGIVGVPFAPTGIVFNPGTDFLVRGANATAPAKFIFVGENGTLAAWSPAVDRDNAIAVFSDPTAVYTGLAMAATELGSFLYAADFLNCKVDVFDTNFARQVPSGDQFTFTDDDVPAGFAPFNIQALATGADHGAQVFVSYALQVPDDNRKVLAGAGLGLVDVYDTNGRLLRRLVGPGAALDAPWGMALAPADFGALGNRVLIGNTGDGRINAYGATTGQFAATLSDAQRVPFSRPGLHGLTFGNDVNNQPHNTLFYATGIDDTANGTFGRIDVGATPPLLNQPPAIRIVAPAAGDINGRVTLTADVLSELPIGRVEYYVDEILLGTAVTAPYEVTWDTSAFLDGGVFVIADAFDTDGNSGVSMPVAVNIANAASLGSSHQGS